jgi:hypothetical protein
MPQHDPDVNAGVYISGGTVSGNVAGSQHGPVIQVNQAGQQTDVLERIEQLLANLDTTAGALLPEQAEEAHEDIDRLRTEVKRRKLNADSIRLVLDRILKTAGSTAGMLAHAEEARILIESLLR